MKLDTNIAVKDLYCSNSTATAELNSGASSFIAEPDTIGRCVDCCSIAYEILANLLDTNFMLETGLGFYWRVLFHSR